MLTTEDIVKAVQRVRQNKGLVRISITGDSRLRDLDLDSLDMAEILVILEHRVGAELDLLSASRLVCVSHREHGH